MGGLLERAKLRDQKADSRSKRETVWRLPAGDPLNGDVSDLVKLADEAKTIDGRMVMHKTRLKDFGERQIVAACVAEGKLPESTMLIRNADGLDVTFVLQDRSSQYGVKDDQVEALELFQTDPDAGELIGEETTFKFNREIMALPGVMQAVEKALEAAVKSLVKSNVITLGEAEDLIEADTKRAFRPGTLDRITEICGRDPGRLAAFLKIMGSSATRFIKVS